MNNEKLTAMSAEERTRLYRKLYKRLEKLTQHGGRSMFGGMDFRTMAYYRPQTVRTMKAILALRGQCNEQH